MNIKTKYILLSFLCFFTLAFSQKPSGISARPVNEHAKIDLRNEWVTMQMLNSASEIQYIVSYDPTDLCDCHCIISVVPESVSLNITHDSEVCYTQTRALTPKQYTTFLNKLHSLGIQSCINEHIRTGGGAIEFIIKKGNKTLFSGYESCDRNMVIANGSLYDSFVPLLTPEMKRIYDNPFNAIDFDRDLIDIDPYLLD